MHIRVCTFVCVYGVHGWASQKTHTHVTLLMCNVHIRKRTHGSSGCIQFVSLDKNIFWFVLILVIWIFVCLSKIKYQYQIQQCANKYWKIDIASYIRRSITNVIHQTVEIKSFWIVATVVMYRSVSIDRTHSVASEWTCSCGWRARTNTYCAKWWYVCVFVCVCRNASLSRTFCIEWPERRPCYRTKTTTITTKRERRRIRRRRSGKRRSRTRTSNNNHTRSRMYRRVRCNETFPHLTLPLRLLMVTTIHVYWLARVEWKKRKINWSLLAKCTSTPYIYLSIYICINIYMPRTHTRAYTHAHTHKY